MTDHVTLTILGAGDAFNSGGLNQSAYLMEGAGSSVLIDCGANTPAALETHGKDPNAIDAVLLTHLHGDHLAGLPFLYLRYQVHEPRHAPLAQRPHLHR